MKQLVNAVALSADVGRRTRYDSLRVHMLISIQDVYILRFHICCALCTSSIINKISVVNCKRAVIAEVTGMQPRVSMKRRQETDLKVIKVVFGALHKHAMEISLSIVINLFTFHRAEDVCKIKIIHSRSSTV